MSYIADRIIKGWQDNIELIILFIEKEINREIKLTDNFYDDLGIGYISVLELIWICESKFNVLININKDTEIRDLTVEQLITKIWEGMM